MEETNVDQPVEAEVAVKANAATVEGTVKSFDFGKGYGFIAHDGSSKEVFVHQEAILGEGNPRIAAGDRVSFELTQGPKGPRAASVRKL
ncbi:MAG: cold shock domain-containing protein [candidate division Zixibacteria bacterium]|nr:cold shock domain-containing protein [candidate division Zixibacteria bacterium]